MAEPAPKCATVIGNGVVGLASAIALQRRGVRVTLVAPDSPMLGASYGNAGHIAVEQIEPLASRSMLRGAFGRLFERGGALSLPLREIGAWLPFSLRLMRASSPARFEQGKAALGAMLGDAVPAWRRLLEAVGAPELLRLDGHFVVWEGEATAAEGRARWAATDIGATRFRDATADELAMLRARIRVPVAHAIRFEGSGQITDLAELATALDACFTAAGGETRRGSVTRIGANGSSVTLDDGTQLSADCVLVAAGAASGTLVEQIGLRAPIVAERGYHIQSPDGEWPADMPPVVFEDRSMIVTRFASGLRAASFVEFGRLRSPPDPRKWDRLATHVAALGLPFPEPVNRWMGARPTLPDYLPAIGRAAATPALAYAFGHQHLGLTLAATTAEAIAALLHGDRPGYDLAPFDLARFR